MPAPATARIPYDKFLASCLFSGTVTCSVIHHMSPNSASLVPMSTAAFGSSPKIGLPSTQFSLLVASKVDIVSPTPKVAIADPNQNLFHPVHSPDSLKEYEVKGSGGEYEVLFISSTQFSARDNWDRITSIRIMHNQHARDNFNHMFMFSTPRLL